MSELVSFLLARLDEDEAAVTNVPEWLCTDSARGEGWGSRGDCPICDKYMFDGSEDVTYDAMFEHFEQAHQRARVLVEVEAKRAIVEAIAPGMVSANAPKRNGWMLRLLALPYADRPGYDERWRP